MCEWLASGEWFDVQLLCGGRLFSAHRAVLASVSNFLRKILLSCPLDETPVFICLPEFDFDVMSSLLNYIYKGEVLVPYQQLKSFLEVAYAMEIYIDQQYIPKTKDYVDFCQSRAVKYYKTVLQNIHKEQCRCCINKTNGTNIEHMFRYIKQSAGNLNFPDKKCGRCHHVIDPNLENIMSQSGFRQRQTLLRDIFIETYSQNGNGNGLTAGVLAISNEHNRSPTSVLLTNANGNHPSASHTLSNTSESTLHRNTRVTSTYESFKQLHLKFSLEDKNNMQDDLKTFQNVFDEKYNFDCILTNHNPQNFPKNSCSYRISGISPQLLSTDAHSSILLEQHHSLNISHMKDVMYLNSLSVVSQGYESPVVPSSCNSLVKVILQGASDLNEEQVKSDNKIAKYTILNEVLQNPWRPHQPNNYKPFRKKFRNFTPNQSKNINKADTEDNNHKNNNRDPQIKHAADIDTEILLKRCERKCATCNKLFTSTDAYEIHMKRHLSVNRYSCVECHKSFSQLRNFKYHMSIHRGTKEFATTCSVCGKYFNDRGYLSSHMKIHRNRKEYKCPSCPKSFNQRVAYNMHVRIHTGEKPHVCEECGKAFSRKMLLKQHQRTHSGERPYACVHCDKRFADRSNMTLHLRLHAGIKPFSCAMCAKSFTKKHHLKAHLNFHTGVKPYACPRCQLTFTQSSNMRTHYKKCSMSDSNNLILPAT